ncbi:MAG: cytochrome-c peroxidase [bacterium]
MSPHFVVKSYQKKISRIYQQSMLALPHVYRCQAMSAILRHFITAFLLVIGIVLSACQESQLNPPDLSLQVKSPNTLPIATNANTPKSVYDKALRERLNTLKMDGNPFSEETWQQLPAIYSPLAQLGKQLFFSKALSVNLDTACASCHHPLLGGGDNLSFPIGTQAAEPDVLGQGRRLANPHRPLIARNAPTTFNSALWEQHIFHDGRIQRLSLSPTTTSTNAKGFISTPDSGYLAPDPLAGDNLIHAQARFPIIAEQEMRGDRLLLYPSHQTLRIALAERLGGYGTANQHLPSLTRAEQAYWQQQFQQVFPDISDLKTLINEQTISRALATYQRSQVFIDSPWRAYVQGDSQAISEPAKFGALLFLSPIAAGGAGCYVCHAGDKFTDEQFHNTAMPHIGWGKDLNRHLDVGRGLVTKQSADHFRFRTPSLLNVTETAPWGHNGAYSTLSAMVRHMLNPAVSLGQYSPTHLTQALGANPASVLILMETWQENSRQALTHENFSLPLQIINEKNVQALLHFLQTLTDHCVQDRACLAPWLPDPQQRDPMYLQLEAKQANGLPL